MTYDTDTCLITLCRKLPWFPAIVWLAICCLLLITILGIAVKRHKHIEKFIIMSCIVASAMVISVGVGLWSIIENASWHGYNELFKGTVDSIVECTLLSPAESDIPNSKKSCLFIAYRFGCDDCETIYPELKKFTDKYGDVYWIATRSKNGRKFIEEYPVSEVPTAVYVKKDGTHLTYPLAEKQDGNTITNQENLNLLKTAMSQDRNY